MSPETLRRALDEGQVVEERFDDLRYLRFDDSLHAIRRGTAVLEGRVMPDYPSIARIFALEAGVRRTFHGRFHGEEKLDGYNLRIARCGDRLLPFTRGGFVCPFTLDRLRDLGDFEPLFAADPDLVLCGELVGPENPYINTRSPRVTEDVRFFAFDLMRLDCTGTLPLAERDALFERFAVPHVPYVGWFTARDMARIRDEVLRLDAEGAEGIIFKPEAEGVRIKYVTPEVNLGDIVVDGSLLAELPSEFFLGRLLRVAMGIEELGLHDRIPAIEERVGHAFVSEFLRVLHRVEEGGKVAKVHRVRLHSDEAADRLMKHLDRVSHKVQVRELERHRDGGWLHLSFEKTYLGSTSRLKTLLEGDYVMD